MKRDHSTIVHFRAFRRSLVRLGRAVLDAAPWLRTLIERVAPLFGRRLRSAFRRDEDALVGGPGPAVRASEWQAAIDEAGLAVGFCKICGDEFYGPPGWTIPDPPICADCAGQFGT